MMTKRLGRGLADLIETAPRSSSNYVILRTDQIRAGRFQPRGKMNDGSFEELKTSIKRQGVIEPVIVRPIAHGTYELVAGERRWRASQAIGLQEVPAIVKTLSDKEALEYSLIENVQREDLNPLEEAKGYARLLDEFGHTQEDIATAVGRDRATIANLVRLLKLPTEIQQGVGNGTITLGHAKVLLAVEDPSKQLGLSRQIIKSGISVRQLEALVGTWAPGKRRRVAQRTDPQAKSLEDELRRTLGTKVNLIARKKGGRIIIEYFSQEDLERILQTLGVARG